MPFPPPTENDSAAADLAWHMHPSTPWHTEWYASNSPEICFVGAFGSCGSSKTARGVILFSDLSMCRYSVTYGTAGAPLVCFRPHPESMSAAAITERAEASRRPVAHEAILHAESLCAQPRETLIPSTSCAHGHLLFCERPGVGRWRDGDDRLRAGDVVEWRTVRIGGAQFGAFAILGDPDHTAVLVEDTVPRCTVADGESVRPDVGVFTVVEQSAGRAPKRESYDLGKLQEGEVWVYRPVGMVEHLCSMLSVEIRSGLETYVV